MQSHFKCLNSLFLEGNSLKQWLHELGIGAGKGFFRELLEILAGSDGALISFFTELQLPPFKACVGREASFTGSSDLEGDFLQEESVFLQDDSGSELC